VFTLTACHRGDPNHQVVGRYAKGIISNDDLQHELQRMPPALRQEFDGPNGRREMVSAMIDKRLLADEAERRGFRDDPDVKRQVREMEERLTIQRLLAEEERAAGSPTDAELRGWYEAHKADLAQPERIRVSRILVSVPAGAGAAERDRARARAQKLASQVRKQPEFSKVAIQGDGPEKAHGGDLGLLVSGAFADKRFEKAAFSLAKPGALSSVVECDEGFAVLMLTDRRPPRIPSFEEARSELENRLAPQRKRKVFDELIGKLRRTGQVRVETAAGPR
jgi:peptidyl-prolyl cis-trans isomerase C